jgi:hypothetical protein
MQAHFAHLSNSSCGGLESDEHFMMKFWYIDQLEEMGAESIAYEQRTYIKDGHWRQPDLAFTWLGRRYAIEVQRSKIGIDNILHRTSDIISTGVCEVFWVLGGLDYWVSVSEAILCAGGFFEIYAGEVFAPKPEEMLRDLAEAHLDKLFTWETWVDSSRVITYADSLDLLGVSVPIPKEWHQKWPNPLPSFHVMKLRLLEAYDKEMKRP